MLQDKIALVTGASSGIGAATARALARGGANVIVNHLADTECANTLVDDIIRAGRRAVAYECDVTDSAAVREMIEKLSEDFGEIDILINNAGVSDDSPIWRMTEEQWDKTIAVNLKGCFNTINALAPRLRERKRGCIVNVASINGLRGKFGLANYSASKAGVIGLTKTIARELGKYQVNVNAVAPGFVLTEMTSGVSDEIKERAVAETALGHLGAPEDIANVIVFLCSDSARHITGEVIRVDGGQLA